MQPATTYMSSFPFTQTNTGIRQPAGLPSVQMPPIVFSPPFSLQPIPTQSFPSPPHPIPQPIPPHLSPPHPIPPQTYPSPPHPITSQPQLNLNQNLCGNINVFGYFKICNTRRGGVEIISQFAIAGSGTLPEFRDHAGGIQEAMQFLAQDIEFWRYQ